MIKHQKAFESLNEAVKVLAASGDDLQGRIMVACRDYLVQLGQLDFCNGLNINFNLLSDKLHLNEEEYAETLLNIDDTEAISLAKAICDFQVQVCNEYFVPGSY